MKSMGWLWLMRVGLVWILAHSLLGASWSFSGSWGLKVDLPSLVGTDSLWTFSNLPSTNVFTPYISSASDAIIMTNAVLEQTLSVFNTMITDGGNSFRMVFQFGYPGGGYAAENMIVDSGWFAITLSSFYDPCICICPDNTCFDTPELGIDNHQLHTYAIEYHNLTHQLFVFVDNNNNPQAVWNNIYAPSTGYQISFYAFVGGTEDYTPTFDLNVTPMQLHSFSFDSDTFVPTPVNDLVVYRRPGIPSITAFSTTDFTDATYWENSLSVIQDVNSGSITLTKYGSGYSWLKSPIYIPSTVEVSTTFQFSLWPVASPSRPSRAGFMFVIQDLGVNIRGCSYFNSAGFVPFPGFGIGFTLQTTDADNGGYVYYYDGSTQEATPTSGTHCALMVLNQDLTASFSIDLYNGWASGMISNGYLDCPFSFSFNPCPVQAIDPLSRSAWVGFTAAFWDTVLQTTVKSFDITSK